MSHNTLANFYQTMFSLVQHHKYSVADLENMYPFERDIYQDMLEAHIKELEDEALLNG